MNIDATKALLNGVFDIVSAVLSSLSDGFQISDVVTISGRVVAPVKSILQSAKMSAAELKELNPDEKQELLDLVTTRLGQLMTGSNR